MCPPSARDSRTHAARSAAALTVIALGAACGRSGLDFGRDFSWGAATAAYQIEGDNTTSDLSAWEELGRLPEKSGKAVNSWERFLDDNRHLAEAGLNAYRLSIEWARLEPQPGTWDAGAAAHYRSLLDDLAARGIRPMVTLHHFTNPLWVDDPRSDPSPTAFDGWRDPRTPAALEGFARRAGAAFGDRVDGWIVLNEPMVYAMGAYVVGRFPPGGFGFDLTRTLFPEVLPNLIEGQVRAGRALRESDRVDADGDGVAARVGVAQNVIPVYPARRPDADAARRFDAVYNQMFLLACTRGVFDTDADGQGPVDRPEWAGALDFIGVNYYTSAAVIAAPVMTPVLGVPCEGTFEAQTGLPTLFGCPPIKGERSDLGSEIVPDGIRRAILDLWERYRLPIVITENGVATLDDDLRSRHLVAHLKAVHQAIRAGARVEGYFYWSLMDNWEWGSFAPRFGLYRVDRVNDFARSPTATVALLRRTAQSSRLADADVAAYAP